MAAANLTLEERLPLRFGRLVIVEARPGLDVAVVDCDCGACGVEVSMESVMAGRTRECKRCENTRAKRKLRLAKPSSIETIPDYAKVLDHLAAAIEGLPITSVHRRRIQDTMDALMILHSRQGRIENS